MRSICRFNDLGIGCCSVCQKTILGRVIQGSFDAFVEGLPVARGFDMVLSSCGHSVGFLNRVSDRTFVNGRGVARVADMFSGEYTGRMMTGAALTHAG